MYQILKPLIIMKEQKVNVKIVPDERRLKNNERFH